MSLQSSIFNKYLTKFLLTLLVAMSFTGFTRYVLGVQFAIIYIIPIISGIGAVLCYMVITSFTANIIKAKSLIKSFIVAVIISTIILVLIYFIKLQLSNYDSLILQELVSLFSIIISNIMLDYEYLGFNLDNNVKSTTYNLLNNIKE